MEPLNPAHTHRSPSPGRPSPVPTPALPGYRGFDNESSYTPRSPTLPSPGPMSPYDHHQPYRDHAFANPYQSRTGTPAAYTPQPQHYNPSAPRPAASPVDMPRYSPYGQPSPGFPFRQPSPGIMPVRQPSPGVMPVRQHSPGIVPYRQPSPGSVNPPPSFATNPPYRGMSPSIPTSPPPPFVSAPASETNEPGRPPSLLQSGRRPVPNSYRDV